MSLFQEILSRSNAVGKIDLDAVVDAVNTLPMTTRIQVKAALQERVPNILWTIDSQGRLQAMQ